MSQGLFIGLMSGTSLDGADAVLVTFSPSGHLEVITHAYTPMPKNLREEFFSLNQPTENELHRSAIAANQLVVQVYAPVIQDLLHQARIPAQQITAIGAHGQTVRHQPHLPRHNAYTIQLNSPALLAELTDITVISDFRNRDIAAGGQGAPLVCGFHAEQFFQPDKTVAVLNLGGIANLTLLFPNQDILGFDCGPANALMDEWCWQHTGKPYDNNGAWASTGAPIPELLQIMLEEPFFSRPLPKSTGRDLFNMDWVNQHLQTLPEHLKTAPQNIQATLLELTAQTIAQSLQKHAKNASLLLVCGGGAYNTTLISRLQQLLAPLPIQSTAVYGLPPLQVEAAAFAWLAKQCTYRQPANVPQVTGARGPRILGCIYQA